MQSFQFVAEEKLLSGYEIHPLKIVGWEGIWGLAYFAILLPILQCIPCYSKLCSHGKVEDTVSAFIEMAHNYKLIIFSILVIIGVACLNSFGVAVTKFSSAT